MVTTAVLRCRPHEMGPARGNTTCGWLPRGFCADSPIRCTHCVSPAAGEGIRLDDSSWALRVLPFPPVLSATCERPADRMIDSAGDFRAIRLQILSVQTIRLFMFAAGQCTVMSAAQWASRPSGSSNATAIARSRHANVCSEAEPMKRTKSSLTDR